MASETASSVGPCPASTPSATGLKELFMCGVNISTLDDEISALGVPPTQLESLSLEACRPPFLKHLLALADLTSLSNLTVMHVFNQQYMDDLVEATSRTLYHLRLVLISPSREPKVWVHAFDNCSDQLETIIVELSVKCFATFSDLEWKALDASIARREWPNLCQVTFKVHPLTGWEAVEESFRGAEYSFVQSSANARKQLSAIDAKNILKFEATEEVPGQELKVAF
ncbi:hypothetical protein C8R44DRAFT_737713 [Mycena epipterygia]|nr:hypothetical protein C8R44DRAFT_737713 [Mycena epipterygia]